MNGHIIPILVDSQMLRKAFLFILFILFTFGLFQVQAQELDEIKLAKILTKSDSIRKLLTYTGIVKLENYVQEKQDILRVWRNKDKFYHHESITPSNEENKLDRNDRRRFSFMPEKKYIQLLVKNYNVSFTEGDKVAERKTMRLSIKPKHLPRFGLSIWFDKERCHILKREFIYYKPKSENLILGLQYQSIQFDVMPPDSLLKNQRAQSRGHDEHSKRPKKIEYKNLAELKEKTQKPIYVPKFIPAGCELVSIKSVKDKHRDFIEMHYADGILNLSLFQFWGRPPRDFKIMLERSTRVEEVPFDFRQVYAVKRDEISFLLIGNFSIKQLKKMADSIVAYK